MTLDIMMIVCGLGIFFLLERWRYYITVRRNFITRIENDRLEAYIELQKLCLASKFKSGSPDHDILLAMSEWEPSLPAKHVFRIVISEKYRRECESTGRELEARVQKMSKNAAAIAKRLKDADIKLVAAKHFFRFSILCIVAVFVLLKTNDRQMSELSDATSELMAKGDSTETMHAYA